MEFGLLGPLRVVDGAGSRRLGGPRQRAVLVHLLLRANREVSQEQLIDAVWGDDPPPTARGSLQSYVSRLRSSLGSTRLEGRHGRYVLRADPDEIDVCRFEALLREARTRVVVGDPEATTRAYRTALDLWRGPALEDLADEPSLRPEIARLEELRLSATEDWVDAELALGRHRELVGELETLVGQHPFRERLWAQLMLALYRSGRQAEALAAYRRAAKVLDDELGVSPRPALRQLHEQVLRQDSALDVAGQPLRGYVLIEQVGEGTFGTVHRAFQPEVGREVAVKVIRAKYADHPDFVRRFGAEGQLIARLEHPHIVPLYDYWREPGGTYLVMRYLRRGSLRQRLAAGPMEPEAVVRLVQQVALGLVAAHRQGVVHRDLKPANVLFDEDGNAYLSDFGIAKDLATADLIERGDSGSTLAAYLSPEEARGDPVTPRSDIYSLGVLAFEALAGRHPFSNAPAGSLVEKHACEPLPSLSALRPGLPSAVDDVIAAATAKDPAERPTDAVAMANALQVALSPLLDKAMKPVGRAEARNPYKGLRPFLEADAGDFHGRRELVDDLVARIDRQGGADRFLAVVGPSGSGKSSVVRAGLVPAVRAGRVPGSDRWFIVELHPGAHPFEELAAALGRVATTPSTGLVDHLRAEPAGLFRAVSDLLPEPSTQLLLVIDQFEEVFTLVESEDERTRFLRALAVAATDPRSAVRVVVTLRADFYDLPLAHPGIAELVGAGTVSVTPLTPAQLERAIAGPAEGVGVDVEPALVAALVAEVTDEAASLPLLQYALTELFDHRDGGRLTLAAHAAIGGVSGALAGRAEDLYARLTRPGQKAARQLFLRLVTVGEEGNRDTRRRVARAELRGLDELDVEPEAMDEAIDAFGTRRLLTFDRDPVTRGPTVEVAHEALLREWTRLRGWIDTARDDILAHRRLAAAAAEWVASGRDDSGLLRGDRLRRFETWAERSGLALTQQERAYIDAGIIRRDAELEAEAARAARERRLERRSLVRLRIVVAVVAVLALTAVGFTLLELAQRRDAERTARSATARELAAAAIASLAQDPELSILLASEAVAATRPDDGIVLREAEEALHRAIRTSRVVLVVPEGGFGLAVAPDGRRFATGASRSDGPAVIWDADSGNRLATLEGTNTGTATHVAFSPDGTKVATANEGVVTLWDARSGATLRSLRGHTAFVTQPEFSPDGRTVAAGGGDGTIRLWDVTDGKQARLIEAHGGPVFDVAFSPDGSRLASAGAGPGVRVWDLSSGEPATPLAGPPDEAGSVSFSTDGRWVASGSLESLAQIWDVDTGELVRSFPTPSPVQAVAFSPDRTRLATAGSDAVARVWDVATGRELMRLAGHGAGPLGNIAFLPDGDRLVTTGLDNTTRVWNVGVGGSRSWLTVPSRRGTNVSVAFGPDGSTFAVPGDPSGVTVRDTESGDEIQRLASSGRAFTSVDFSPDGTRLIAASETDEGTPVIWDVRTGDVALTLEGHDGVVGAVAFAPEGDRIITGGRDGTARVWDGASGRELAILRHAQPVTTVATSPDGRLIATGEEEGAVTVWDATSFTKVRALTGHENAAVDLAFGPDGSLVSASIDGTARIWDLASGSQRFALRGHRSSLTQVAISPDGTRIATTAEDATTMLWDPRTGQERLTLVGHEGVVSGVDFSPDGRLLATSSPDGTTALTLLPVGELTSLARERVTRGLTDEECGKYLHVASCP